VTDEAAGPTTPGRPLKGLYDDPVRRSPPGFVESASRFTAGCRATKWLVTTVILERPVPRTMIRHLPKLDLIVNFVTTKWN
jgi:hypothetical protein